MPLVVGRSSCWAACFVVALVRELTTFFLLICRFLSGKFWRTQRDGNAADEAGGWDLCGQAGFGSTRAFVSLAAGNGILFYFYFLCPCDSGVCKEIGN